MYIQPQPPHHLIDLTVGYLHRQGTTDIHCYTEFHTGLNPSGNPDVSARMGSTLIFAKIETRENLQSATTVEHYKELFGFACLTEGCLILVVEEADKSLGQALLQQVSGEAENAFLLTFAS